MRPLLTFGDGARHKEGTKKLQFSLKNYFRTNNPNIHSFTRLYYSSSNHMIVTMKMLTLKLCVSAGDKKIIHNADSACLSFLVSSALLTFLSEKTSFLPSRKDQNHKKITGKEFTTFPLFVAVIFRCASISWIHVGESVSD